MADAVGQFLDIIDNRIEKHLDDNTYGYVRQRGAVVTEYDNDSKKAFVYFVDDESRTLYTFYNKTNELLSSGDNVKVFYTSDIIKGWIGARCGEPNIKEITLYGGEGVGRPSPWDNSSEYFNSYEKSGKNIAGDSSKTNKMYAHAEGYNTKATGRYSHSEGYSTTASGNYSHSEGGGCNATGQRSHAEGDYTTASGNYSHSEGSSTESTYFASHAEGYYTHATGYCCHAEGNSTTASNKNSGSHAEGYNTKATGDGSHAEGISTTASGNDGSHSEGGYTTASGDGSHAEGRNTTASGVSSHSEGYNCKSSGNYSHSEGSDCEAMGECSHAGGYYCKSNYQNSFVHGYYLEIPSSYLANSKNCFCRVAFGQYNDFSDENIIFSIGNGGYDANKGEIVRSNAFSIDLEGNVRCKSINGIIPSSGGDTLIPYTTEEAVNSAKQIFQSVMEV